MTIVTKKEPDPKKLAIGQRIMAARKRKKLSREQLAELCEVSGSAVGQWEAGYTMPSMSVFDQLPELLNVDREWLLTGSDPGNRRVPRDVLEEEALLLMHKMTFRQKMDLVRMITGLVGESDDVNERMHELA